MTRRQKTQLTQRGVILSSSGILMAVCGFLIGSPELIAIALVMIIITANSWVLEKVRTPLHRVDLRATPERLTQNSHVDFHLTVTGVNAHAWKITLNPPSALGDAITLATGITSHRFAAKHRGVFPLGTIVADRSDPLQLAKTRAVTSIATHVTVYPHVVPLSRDNTRLLSRRSSQLAHQNLLANTAADDVALRPYSTGDDLRRVHWNATAKRGDLVVRTGEDAHNRSLVIFVDNRENPDARDRVEQIISSAASGALLLIRYRWDVHIQTLSTIGGSRTVKVTTTADALFELARTPIVSCDETKHSAPAPGTDTTLLRLIDGDLPSLITEDSRDQVSKYRPAGSMVFSSTRRHTLGEKATVYVDDNDSLDGAWSQLLQALS